ncbi:RNA polymerase sigma factor [Nakamurella endophytica]|uniref:RNA polymerase sigma factor n=1 Tax=Nakamurella endophytica TaxID=1748367 RepID=UPI001664DE58
MEDELRACAPSVLATLAGRYGQFDACEDAVQDALLAASTQWPVEGVPDNPRGWLLTVAGRRLTDAWRSESARRRREDAVGQLEPVGAVAVPDRDDTLTLLLLCCHPAVSADSQVALTLRAVGGLTTAEIAGAFFVPEATMAQRISRAKQRIRASGARFELPPAAERPARLASVRQVLYLVFNEGYTASSGDLLYRADLSAEAIRLTRMLAAAAPDEVETAGLLALMLLTDARRPARTDLDGLLVALPDQDRGLWDRAAIEEGVGLLTRTLGTGPVGPYQLQAAIAAVHDEAPTAADTDWPQILALYDVLLRGWPSPVVALNRVVAVAMVHGARPGLAELGVLAGDAHLARSHRLDAVRAHLLELAGETAAAREAYRRAAGRATNRPEQVYLAQRAARLG